VKHGESKKTVPNLGAASGRDMSLENASRFQRRGRRGARRKTGALSTTEGAESTEGFEKSCVLRHIPSAARKSLTDSPAEAQGRGEPTRNEEMPRG
jgi:hypothetical protein